MVFERPVVAVVEVEVYERKGGGGGTIPVLIMMIVTCSECALESTTFVILNEKCLCLSIMIKI